MAPHAPSASPRFAGGTAAERIVRVKGITIAPPRPWIARAMLSTSTFGASAAPTDATVKTPTPIANILRRPNRSPSAAPVSRKTANVSVYALTVHERLSREAWRSVLMTGIAVETTRLSRETMNSAIEVITKVQMVLVRWVIGGAVLSSVFACD